MLPRVPLRQWVLSVPFQLRFLFASYPELMGTALGIVYRTIATWLIHRGGFAHNTARTGAVTFIQRFGSALNLNIHSHILFLDGVYVTGLDNRNQLFRRTKGPDQAALQTLVSNIASRLAQFLVKEGLLEQDIENSYLSLEHLVPNPLQQVHGHSITYRIAVGPQQGKKVFTLQTLLPRTDQDRIRAAPGVGPQGSGRASGIRPHSAEQGAARPGIFAAETVRVRMQKQTQGRCDR